MVGARDRRSGKPFNSTAKSPAEAYRYNSTFSAPRYRSNDPEIALTAKVAPVCPATRSFAVEGEGT
jgi:hypothetical protein